eukprot:1326434-Prorocentrum_lima.AAC.1
MRPGPSLPLPPSRVMKPGRGGQIVAGCHAEYPRMPMIAKKHMSFLLPSTGHPGQRCPRISGRSGT